ECIRGGRWNQVRYMHRSEGIRHRQLWTLMAHADQLNIVERGSLFKHYPTYATVRFHRRSLPDIIYNSVVNHRRDQARKAAIAILGLKKRMAHHGMNKDMCALVAKMVYLNYENRYSDKWGQCNQKGWEWGFTHFSEVLLCIGMMLGVLWTFFELFWRVG
ncbi:MAG: hypothetical protein ABIP54_04965, partial [Candidatus Andersenbacteria bacterium]